jgi:hypothetical protein
MSYFKDKEMLAAFVNDQLASLSKGSALTMTIIPGQFGDYSVRTVTDVLSEDIGETLEHSFLRPPTNT